MKRIISIVLVLSIVLCAVPNTVFGADYDYEVIYIPDNSDAPVYRIGDYVYIGDNTIMRKDGNIITSGKYKFDFYKYRAECFENGYIEVREEATGLMGLMNENGEMVTEVKYSDIEPFDEKGMAIAAIQGEKYGMIDKEGNVVIPFKFDYMRRCNHDELLVAGLNKYSTDPNADVTVSGTYYGLIDRKGNIVLPIEYEEIENFDSNGFIKTGKRRVWDQGLVNNKGEVILEVEYRNIYIYNGGEYIEALDNSFNGYWFDKDGNNIFPEYDYAETPSRAGLGLIVTTKDGKQGLAKYDGTILLEAIYDRVEPTVSDGFVKLEKDGQTEWAKSNGEVLRDAHYEDCDNLYAENDSLYTLKQDGLWAIAIGENVGEFKYTEIDDMSYFERILFCTKQDGAIDGIDALTGEIIYENVFEGTYNSSYRSKYFYVENNQTYLITYDKKLKPAWPDKYVHVGEFENNVAVAKNKENLWGLINEKGEPITEFKYESFYVCVGVNHGDEVYNEHIYFIDNGLVMVMLDGKIGYINLKGETVIEPKFGRLVWNGYGIFRQGYAPHNLIGGGECYIDLQGNIYEKERISFENYPMTSISTDYHYRVLCKDGDVEIWDADTNKRIMFSVGNTIYREDGSFVVNTILRNENGSLKVRYEYDGGISVWTEFGRFIIDIE